MGLVIDVEFLTGGFAASDGHDGTAPEWPPAPARLFAALVAACEADEPEALSWLERQGAPVIDAGHVRVAPPHARWLVTNRVEPDGGSASHVARTNVMRARRRCWMSSPQVRYRWAGDVPDGMAGRLDGVARQVGYLGRPTSPVLVRVSEDAAQGEPMPGLVRYGVEPVAAPPLLASVQLRSTYPGLLAGLDAAFEAGDRVDPPVRVAYHRHERPPVVAERPGAAAAAPWSQFAAFEVPPERWIPAQRGVVVADAFRKAVLSRIGDEAHPLVTGHGVDAPHVGFVPLPSVGHPRADGHLLGVALALPPGDPLLFRQVREAFHDAEGELSIRFDNLPRGCVPDAGGGRPSLRLSRRAGGSPWGRRFDRYTATSRFWRTVTPAVLDRSPSARLSEEEAVRMSVVRAGYPEPVAIWSQKGPIRAGDPSLRMADTLRRQGDRRRPFRYLLLRFAEPVRGPVIVGAMRHFGLGLCLPERVPEGGGND